MIIIRVIVFNFHHQYRDFKQTNKTIMNLAIRAFSFFVKKFLIRLLNEINVHVLKIRNNERNQTLLQKKNEFFIENMIFVQNIQFDSITDVRIIITVQNFMNLNLSVEIIDKRFRKISDRFANKMLQNEIYVDYDKNNKRHKKQIERQ